ncbi:MAG: tRNA preQ1(34) S-adenosylmethionine ribosyltransferase-isomerase QueA [Tenericutes bacterium GWC2_34_14]|nr:MAG: tRNA preQ1(34) S-adenosylmethionine ribosyltransferase-isomerase QueA [Tenericutes bacterium GWC2_34_14]OHE34561.1 MAG: tRNA preQ1(34) S-adenosylmethionine ribosyltransferase-isomerase QueA [Tenericutes bacterium GWE2_34_108]OHE35918.1 MAG: tRNA preQ1(34) S-adenosylmethionine ribosyltransferase-isomerase QueA [Tenericutes bacterium GWF1_35_14]OHE38996.1 MAG: tRNA preQ1(34) S-adenosylmethionine ribosyltransferase-isomerase QueA [Tenericutes bacterium GWF2_35_184]OHE42319.1 MAG: tRNA preQ
MKVNDFDFELPKELIAQHPSEKRDHSRLMVLNREAETIEHRHFYDILDYLTDEHVLVLNNTKVIPARLMGIKEDTDAMIELLLLKEVEPNIWEAMTKPAKRVKVGTIIRFSNLLKAECIQVEDEGLRIFKMYYEGIFIEILEQLGTMPLPPYITEKLSDKDRYQTVYAKTLGSAAAPTAGLHFTKELLRKIEEKGIEIIPITLHVGLGTFKPVQVEKIEAHHMHEETYTMSEQSAKRLNKARENGKKIVCVGTTSVRTLESNFNGQFIPGTFDTSIFIYPGYQFRVIDMLITNFHLPKSTLIMLVSALSNREFMLKAYHEAIHEKYRFFSFGDAMLIK